MCTICHHASHVYDENEERISADNGADAGAQS